MALYATKDEINEFRARLGSRPLFVLDIDGNAAIGYRLNEGHSLPLGEGDDPANQSIPFGPTQDQLESLVAGGTLSKHIFAAKTMDVRLPRELADLLNYFNETNQPFRIALLTSRRMEDAQKILAASGVKNVGAVTLVADSGATLTLAGHKKDAPVLTREEEEFCRGGLTHLAKDLQPVINLIVATVMGEGAALPNLEIEYKGIGSNIHWRRILETNGQGDGSPLDLAIKAKMIAALGAYEETGPEKDGRKIFKMLEGPATVELKLASVDKSKGLAALLEYARDHHCPPTTYVFSGDDYKGTDGPAARERDALSARFGIAGFNVQTLHPEGGDMNGREPDLSRIDEGIAVDLFMRTPEENVGLVTLVYGDLVKNSRPGKAPSPSCALG